MSDPTEPLWGHLHWLVVLARQGSYTAAARRLGVSKAAMSQRIAELERHAGVPLVTRTTRHVHLTDAGLRLVADTAGAFDDIAQRFAAVQDLAGTPRGVLRVTAPMALARQHLTPHLPTFLEANPEVRLELDLSDRIVSLPAEGFDLAIRHTEAPPETHVAWRLATTHSILVASPAYLAAHGAPAHPEDLREHQGLFYPRAPEAPAWTFERLGQAHPERVTVPIHGPLAANNSEVLRDAALSGLGIAMVPDFSAQAALCAGQLVHVLPRWKTAGAFAESIYAVRPYAVHVPLGVRRFVDFLKAAWKAGFGA